MEGENKVLAMLGEIRAELRHLNQRMDESLAHYDQVSEMRHTEHEKRIQALEIVVPKLDKRLVAYSAVISAAIVATGILVRLL